MGEGGDLQSGIRLPVVEKVRIGVRVVGVLSRDRCIAEVPPYSSTTSRRWASSSAMCSAWAVIPAGSGVS